MNSYMLHWFLVVNIFWSPCKVVYWGILKSLQKKKMHPEKNLFSKEMQTFTFEISNNPKKRTELPTISSRKQDRGSM